MLSSNELMLLQQEFAETSAKLRRSKSDYERSKALYDEKIGAERDYVANETEYDVIKSQFHSLKLRLEILNLNTAKIEAGDPYAAFAVISPINGYITSLNLVLGQFTEQQKSLLEIVDINKLQLQLSVFETDLNKLEPGQTVWFNSLGAPASVHTATLISIGKTIHPESRTIQCIAKITNENKMSYINRSYIDAIIKVDRRAATSLPNDAILKSGNSRYIYVVEKQNDKIYSLRREKVTTGRVSKDYTEIIGAKELSKVIVSGVYNLPAE
jgi:cobalt-zinc-cadmium efflux system membrane fusion protein